MRQILIGDIIAAARTLLELPGEKREEHLREMLYHARIADKVRKRTGKPHRDWGNGSLMAAAFPRPSCPEPVLSNRDYLMALRLVTDVLLQERDGGLGSPYGKADNLSV